MRIWTLKFDGSSLLPISPHQATPEPHQHQSMQCMYWPLFHCHLSVHLLCHHSVPALVLFCLPAGLWCLPVCLLPFWTSRTDRLLPIRSKINTHILPWLTFKYTFLERKDVCKDLDQQSHIGVHMFRYFWTSYWMHGWIYHVLSRDVENLFTIYGCEPYLTCQKFHQQGGLLWHLEKQCIINTWPMGIYPIECEL